MTPVPFACAPYAGSCHATCRLTVMSVKRILYRSLHYHPKPWRNGCGKPRPLKLKLKLMNDPIVWLNLNQIGSCWTSDRVISQVATFEVRSTSLRGCLILPIQVSFRSSNGTHWPARSRFCEISTLAASAWALHRAPLYLRVCPAGIPDSARASRDFFLGGMVRAPASASASECRVTQRLNDV